MPPILSLFYLGFHFYHLIGNSEPYLTEVNVCFSFSCLLSRSVMSDSFDPKNSSPSGFSVHGILQARILKWVACPPPWDLPDPGIKPTCLMSPALRSRFFANSATCEALVPLLVLGRYIYLWIRVSQVVLVIKNPPANEGDARDSASIPGLGRSPEVENGNPLQYSCLKNSMDRGDYQATVLGIAKSHTRLNGWTCIHNTQGSKLPHYSDIWARLDWITGDFRYMFKACILFLSHSVYWALRLT